MALQVCEYPTCRKLTLTKRCHAHPVEEGETDHDLDERLAKVLTDAPSEPVSVVAHVRKAHTMSTETRKKISEAVKRRHAKAGHNMKTEEPVTTHNTEKPADTCRGKYCRAAALPSSWYCETHQNEPARAQLPAKHTTAPITLAEPRIVNGTAIPRSVDLHGNAVTVLDSFIGKLQSDLAMLQGAKDIMEHYRR